MTTASNSARRLVGIVAWMLAPCVAHAQTPATAEQVESARSLYHDARELHQQGKLKEAIALSLEAYRTAPTPVTARQAGRWLIEAGRLVEARDIMIGVAAMPVSPRESDKGRDARQEAAALAIELDARIPKVSITSRPSGVDVLLDGRAFGARDERAALPWQGVDPGAHVFTVRSGEKTCATINVTLAERQARTIDLHESAPACVGSDAPTTTRITGPIANDPPQISAPNNVAPNRASARGMTATQWAGIATASVGVVAMSVGGLVGLGAKSDYDSVASQCGARGCTQAAFDKRHDAGARADVATIAAAVGAAALVTGAVMWIVGRPSSETVPTTGKGEPRIAIAPTGLSIPYGIGLHFGIGITVQTR